ncbi:hypothetical protein QL093DRAFT_2100959 [Fusarium oxysporum]|nr:hypothetical protein QL093DRAFT_2100959 [Fusarium oxysporum]
MREIQRLCFTAGVGDNPDFNLIAYADLDQFKIAATKDKFTNGAKFNISTNPTAIKFGEVYTPPPTWYDGTISTATLPCNSFKFINKTSSEASAVLFRTVISQGMPFYISSSSVDPWTKELMSPSSVAALLFQNYAEAGTMVSAIKSDLSMFGSSSQSSL